MRKKLALVLAATLAFSMFAVGCGSSEPKDEGSTTPKQEESSDKEDETPATPSEKTYDAEKLELTTFWESGHSASYAIVDGQTLSLEFKATTLEDFINPETELLEARANWDNWVLACTTKERTAEDYDATAESIVLRADCFGWANDYADNAVLSMTLNGGDMVWDNWVKDHQAGGDVKLTVTRDGNKFTLAATTVANGNTYQYDVTWEAKVAVADTMYIFLTGEDVTIDITSAVVK